MIKSNYKSKISLATIAFIVGITLLLVWRALNEPSLSVTIHLAGDSTLSSQLTTRRPLTGWGEPFSMLVCEDIGVLNHARNGRSTKSFIDEGHWQQLLNQLSAGDFVFIQFAHNDQKEQQASLYSAPWEEYRRNLERFIQQTRTAAAIPILLTPIVRRNFAPSGALQNSHGSYPEVVRAVAREANVLLIDLNAMTHRWIEQVGPEESKDYFLHLAPGEHHNYESGVVDNTHLSPSGALEIARMVAIELKSSYPKTICGTA